LGWAGLDPVVKYIKFYINFHFNVIFNINVTDIRSRLSANTVEALELVESWDEYPQVT